MKFKNHLLLILLVGLLLVITSCAKEEDCVEVPNSNCICTYEYNPVCGCNEKTYGNACAAECAGVSYTKGECN